MPLRSISIRPDSFLAAAQLYLLIGGLLLMITPVRGQSVVDHRPWENYAAQHWDSENMLQQNCITGIYETSNHYLWLSSFNGLWRFDGQNFKPLNAYNRQGLNGEILAEFFEDSRHRIWMCYRHRSGVYLYQENGDTMIYMPFAGKPLFDSHKGIAERQGQILVATADCIYRVNRGRLQEAYRLSGPGLSINRIKTIRHLTCVLTTRGAYAITARGLIRLSRYGQANVQDIVDMGSPDDELLLADSCLYRCSTQGKSLLYRQPAGTSLNSPSVDRQGKIWFLVGNQVKRIDEYGLDGVDQRYGLQWNDFSTVFCDRSGNIWLGHQTHGLSRLRAKLVQSYLSEKTPGSGSLGPLLPLGPDSLLVSAYCAGLSTFSGGNFHRLPMPWLHKEECVWGILRDHNGQLWYGTWAGGVHRVRNGELVKYLGRTPTSNVVFALFEDRQLNIWAGTQNGLMRFTGRDFISESPELLGCEVRAIKQDRKGRLLCCTSKGLYILENGRIKNRYSVEEGLSHNRVRDVLEDASGNYWITTYGGGLNVLTRGRIFAFNSVLLDPFCSGLAVYDDQLFISTNNGLYYAPLQHLLSFASGNNDVALFSCINQRHGMSTNECNGGAQPCVATLGRYLYFPTVDGLARLDAQAVKDQGPPEGKLVIEAVSVEGQTITPTNGIYRLPGSGGRVEVSYTCPELSDPQNMYFQNKLVGEHVSWSAPSRQRKLEMILSPGEHDLAIRTYRQDTNNHASDLRLRLSIPLPLYKKTWFIYAVIFLLAVIFYIAFRMRIRIIRKKEEYKTIMNKRHAELEMKAFRNQMNPHFIFNCLNNIKFFVATGDSRAANAYVDSFGRVVRHVTEYSLANVIPLGEELKLLKEYVKLEQMRFDHFFTFEVNLPPDSRPPALNVPNMMLQPLLENAIRHGLKPATGPCHLELEVCLQNNRLLIRVIDNGVGIDPAKAQRRPEHNSVALSNIRQRIVTLNYLFNSDISMQYINRTPGEHGSTGTIVELNLPTDL